MITKIVCKNFKGLRDLCLVLPQPRAILVGPNGVGKSTLLEAITLATRGRIAGRPFLSEASPSLFNREAVRAFLRARKAGEGAAPPEILVELYLKDTKELAELRGTNNTAGDDCPGIQFRFSLEDSYRKAFDQVVEGLDEGDHLPADYYRASWLAFTSLPLPPRQRLVSVAAVDSSTVRAQSGLDAHVQDSIAAALTQPERAALSHAFRAAKSSIAGDAKVQSVSARFAASAAHVTKKVLSLEVDVSTRAGWEGAVTVHLDGVPFSLSGKGEQAYVKTMLALARGAAAANIVLVEEPEAHLSFSALRELLDGIDGSCVGKQLVVATHSPFVVNKLGVNSVVVFGPNGVKAFENLPEDTVHYFKVLPGYDTLRVALAKKAVLVEGPSDELIFQRGYMDQHDGRVPGADGVEVVSVGLSHRRFVELVYGSGVRIAIIRDNDGQLPADLAKQFADFTGDGLVTFHTHADPDVGTLEPAMLEANGLDWVSEICKRRFTSRDEALAFMKRNKTTFALNVLETALPVRMPAYILDAIDAIA